MSMFRKIATEPLVQFLVLGVAVFGLYSGADKSHPDAGARVIEVGKGQLTQMFETFSRTWQRPPTEAEVQGFIDSYVKEEVFYREGTDMRLDRDDTVIRRRMQQKMEFLLEPSIEDLTPKPGELEAYLKAHADKYRIPAQLAFRQVLFKSDAPGDKGEMAATQALASLRTDPLADISAMGEPTLLPARVDLTSADMIAAIFDEEVAKELASAPIGQWFGPVRSAYGVHLMFVEDKVAPRAPSLDDVKAAVKSDWESARRGDIADRRYVEMKKRYEIKVVLPEDLPAPIETSGVP
ncbi:peptidylprolyl isomerase [Pararhizobium sp. LjRoot255]|uniref:peptidylprolyl isomerase n=1 Tax=Pararhizobium sp. LjRoot255 TaxID=3342298 RepID=UPI003ED0E3DD